MTTTLTLTILAFTLWPHRSLAQPPSDRRSWALDALAPAPSPTFASAQRSRLGMGLYQFGDAFGLMASGLVSVGMVEFRARYSGQFFTAYTDEGAALRPQYETRAHWATAEIASYFMSPRGEGGRLGLEYLRAFPSAESYLKLSLQTSLLSQGDTPWRFVLEAAYFFPVKKGPGDTLSVRMSVDKGMRSGWNFGGRLSIVYRMGPIPAPGTYEIAMISLGPTFRRGDFTAGANLRLLLDKRTELAAPEKNISVLRPPDLYISWEW